MFKACGEWDRERHVAIEKILKGRLCKVCLDKNRGCFVLRIFRHNRHCGALIHVLRINAGCDEDILKKRLAKAVKEAILLACLNREANESIELICGVFV